VFFHSVYDHVGLSRFAGLWGFNPNLFRFDLSGSAGSLTIE
jgi:hypothetical protein